MKKICIFCGSSMGFDPIYREKAAELGRVLADNHCELLYGGGNVGLMNIIAEVMKERHCRIVGTITQHLLDMRVGRPDIDELIVVETMAERKKILEDMADAFIAMPGGVGTMDEFFEAITLRQLGLLQGTIVLLNTQGFYTPLVAYLEQMAEQGFMSRNCLKLVHLCDTPEAALEVLLTPDDLVGSIRRLEDYTR